MDRLRGDDEPRNGTRQERCRRDGRSTERCCRTIDRLRGRDERGNDPQKSRSPHRPNVTAARSTTDELATDRTTTVRAW
jgi:hypothetical protein